MTAFVLAAAALTLLAMGAVLFGPRRRQGAAAVSQSRTSARVLREQLADLEAERARGLLDEAEFARLRDDLQRRLLAEADAVPASGSAAGGGRRGLRVAASVLPLAAAALYWQFGNPQMATVAATAGPPATAQVGSDDDVLLRLEAHLVASPNDARGWVMLARARMQRDQFEPAAAAYQRALDVSSKVARDPLIWCEYADALGMAAGGRLAGKPRELIDKALALDASHPRALEMAGSAAYEAGDFRDAARYWQQLLALLPADSPEHGQLAAAVARAERKARFNLPSS